MGMGCVAAAAQVMVGQGVVCVHSFCENWGPHVSVGHGMLGSRRPSTGHWALQL